eukprot:5460078-Amphidinium_carterae.1
MEASEQAIFQWKTRVERQHAHIHHKMGKGKREKERFRMFSTRQEEMQIKFEQQLSAMGPRVRDYEHDGIYWLLKPELNLELLSKQWCNKT